MDLLQWRTRSKIDYFAIEKGFLRKVVDARVSEAIGTGLDHRTIEMVLEMDGTAAKPKAGDNHKKHKRIKTGWRPQDEDTFRKSVSDRLRRTISADEAAGTVVEAERKCEIIEQILLDMVIGQPGCKTVKRIDDGKASLRKLIDERKKARTRGDREDVKSFCKQIRKEARAIDRATKTAKIRTILDEFRGLQSIAGIRANGKTDIISSVLTADGKLVTDRCEVADTFAAFYESLYSKVNRAPGDTTIKPKIDRSNIHKISKEEVQTQLKTMRKNKCADEAGLVKEALDYGGIELAEELADIFNQILFRTSAIPQSWRMSKISILFKKGDRRLPENYRPICIIPIIYKLFSRVLLKRIGSGLDQAQSRDQAGFRPHFGCDDHIFITSRTSTTFLAGLPHFISKRCSTALTMRQYGAR